ncbi:four helix bundle protein [Candidatus Woesebacteria bacterium CG_4_10_14_0_2_um_filter_39_14]|uniref:Four helix bundle protein n=2 Tax=Candidatus Woeseibacteriota TaxID=1752722 RepID=A0A2M7X931_9BACT|nr:MAG: four helix bundle protein [Candidatus Woesebacteria bacterium CG_4_10_14_0_2_um_filter_39_14]PJA42654.1 MAG: four helix bundle protein [Candidatus Woesebacteria bacterium CG_4_9_14_3_um_filter_39_10]
MNKYSGTEKDIHIRIHKFVTSCFVNIIRKIPKTPENIPIIQQISASLTSIGANDQEADAANSNKDFILKYTIAKKETKETKYWLSLISDTVILEKTLLDPYIRESQEILLIISKIIQNSKINLSIK